MDCSSCDKVAGRECLSRAWGHARVEQGWSWEDGSAGQEVWRGGRPLAASPAAMHFTFALHVHAVHSSPWAHTAASATPGWLGLARSGHSPFVVLSLTANGWCCSSPVSRPPPGAPSAAADGRPMSPRSRRALHLQYYEWQVRAKGVAAGERRGQAPVSACRRPPLPPSCATMLPVPLRRGGGAGGQAV